MGLFKGRRIFSSNEDSIGEGRYEPNHYELLHVQSHADREIIDLAATFLRHSSAAQSGFTATREQISAAYHTLVDPELRAEYDRKLGLVCAGTPATGYHTTGSQEAPADRTPTAARPSTSSAARNRLSNVPASIHSFFRIVAVSDF